MKTKNITALACLVLALLFGATGLAAAGHGRPDNAKGKVSPLKIPEGQLPPPGECRIWFPGTPPGQQPPPGRCASLRDRVPPGAWLLVRPKDKAREVAVNVYHAETPKMVLEVRYHDVETGLFLRFGAGR